MISFGRSKRLNTKGSRLIFYNPFRVPQASIGGTLALLPAYPLLYGAPACLSMVSPVLP